MLRAHHKVWLVGATFAPGSLAVLVVMYVRMGAEVTELRTIERRDIPQQQLLTVVVGELVTTRLALAVAGGAVPGFTVSFGVAPGAPDASFDEVVAEADSALYTAKRSGRNRVVRANETAEPDGAAHADVH